MFYLYLFWKIDCYIFFTQSVQYLPKHSTEFYNGVHATNIQSSQETRSGPNSNVAAIYTKRAEALFSMGEYKV